MAAAKKTVKPVAVTSVANAPKAEAKKAETPAAVKAETKKAETPAAVKVETKKAESPATAVVKAETKKVEDSVAAKKVAAKKTPVKKTTAKKAEKPAAEKKETVKKAAIKTEIELQISGEKYTQEKLLKIAKDVWEYDLEQKASELTSVELYVKPDERLVYYVMNKEFTGSFGI